MTEQQKKEAIEYIEGQLKYGYVDLGFHDECELEIVEEAIRMWKAALLQEEVIKCEVLH